MTYREAYVILHPDTAREAVQKIQKEKSTKEVMDAVNEACMVACEALEKQIAKKPTIWGDGYADGHLVYDMYDCPNCGDSFEIDGEQYDYCPHCGQAIDWSDE